MLENELKRIADALEIIAGHYKQLDAVEINEIDIVRTPTETVAIPRTTTDTVASPKSVKSAPAKKEVTDMGARKMNMDLKKPVEQVKKEIEERTGNKELAEALAKDIEEEEKNEPVAEPAVEEITIDEPKVEAPKAKKARGFGKQLMIGDVEEELLEGANVNPFEEINNIDSMTIKSEVTPVEFSETKEEVPFEEPKPKKTTAKKKEPAAEKPVEKPKAKKSSWDDLDW